MKLFGLIAAVSASKELFNEWKETQGVKYASPKEEAMRFDQWMKNKEFVDEHMLKHAAGKVSFTVGMNKFADLSGEEFAEKYLAKVWFLLIYCYFFNCCLQNNLFRCMISEVLIRRCALRRRSLRTRQCVLRPIGARQTLQW